MSYQHLLQALKGGAGSGNFGHSGRPGKVGGSAPKSGTPVGLIKPSDSAEEKIDVTAYAVIIAGLDFPTATHEHVPLALGWNSKVRSKVKDDICTALSDATGLSYEAVNDAIKQWASTSNDNDMRSLSMQEAATKVFGNELSNWQKGNIDKIHNTNFSALTENQPMFADNHQPYATADDAQKALLKAMYDSTQREFAKQGIKTVTLYRGSRPAYAPTGSDIKSGDAVNMKSNAIESWTVHPLVAREFGYNVLKAEIPVDRILSTARTGFGCLNEYEFTVLGGMEGDVATAVQYYR